MTTTSKIESSELTKLKQEKETKLQEKKLKMKNFLSSLSLELNKAISANHTENQYLFELAKNTLSKKLYPGIYKATIIKILADKGVILEIKGLNFRRTLLIKDEELIETSEHKNIDEDLFQNLKAKDTYTLNQIKIRNLEGMKKKDIIKKIQLSEFEYNDSVVFKIEKNKEIKKIHIPELLQEIKPYVQTDTKELFKKIEPYLPNPENILKKIKTFLPEETETNTKKNKKNSAQIAMILSFLSESRNDDNTRQFIKDFYKRTKNKNKKEITEIFKRYVRQQNMYVHRENDIDKSAAVFLLEKCGFYSKSIQEISHDQAEQIKEGILIDVGATTTGIKVEKHEGTKKSKITLSEHSDKSEKSLFTNRPNSTTHIIFSLLKQIDAIPDDKKEHIQRFVDFVNVVDSMDYQVNNINYSNNYKTLFGLYRVLPIKEIFDYFAEPGNTGFEDLSQNDLFKKKFKIFEKEKGLVEKSLKEISQNDEQRRLKNIANFTNTLAREPVNLINLGKKHFIIDLENNLKDGTAIAGLFNCGLCKIGKERGNFYLYSPELLHKKEAGFTTDGHFLTIDHPTVADIDQLFEKFYIPPNANPHITEQLKNKLIQKQEKIEKKQIKIDFSLLPNLKESQLQIGQTISGIINNIFNNCVFITINRQNTLTGIVHKNDLPENIYIKDFEKGDKVQVKIEKIEKKGDKTHINFSLIKH